MLTGRESLVRLIGKRRRSLPNRHLLLSAPIPNSLNLEVNDNGNLISVAGDDGLLSENLISPDDSSKISDDLSLSTRKKRRLTQTTLLQSSFWSGPNRSEDGLVICTQQQPIFDSEASELCLVQTSEPSDSICCKVEDGSCSPCSGENLKTVTLDEASGEAIQTFIVGRKFSDVQDLEIGGNIFLLRHPENIKDRNAIKVVSADSEMLGYLPKDISQCLSPLIDDYDLKFEGTIISVPKNSSEAVPIKVVCHKMTSDGWKECEFYGDFNLFGRKFFRLLTIRCNFRLKQQDTS